MKALLKSQKLIMKSLHEGHTLEAQCEFDSQGRVIKLGKFWWNSKLPELARNPSHTTLFDLRRRRLIQFKYAWHKCSVTLSSKGIDYVNNDFGIRSGIPRQDGSNELTGTSSHVSRSCSQSD